MTQLRINSAIKLASVLALAVSFLSIQGVCLHAQTTADELYTSVQKLQASLGSGEEADRIRDQFRIRELESESGRGFIADTMRLQEVANQFAASQDLSPEMQVVKLALDSHLRQLESAASVDVLGEVAGLKAELTAVDAAFLEDARQSAIEGVRKLRQHNDGNLSIYGAYYLNRRLKIESLQKALEDFEVKSGPFANNEEANAFNRDLNQFRQTVALAHRRIGLASTEYRGEVFLDTERKLIVLDKRVFAYLLAQTTRAKQTFEGQLAQRKQVFVSNEGVVADANGRLFQAELGRWIGLLEKRGELNGLGAAIRRQYSKPNFKLTVQESLANRVGGQSISQMEHLDEVIVGSRAQGWTYTSGRVGIDFVNSPVSAYVRIGLAGDIQSSAYSKEGPVTAYTQSFGHYHANRDVEANIGNVSVYGPGGNAQVWSEFLGTNKKLGLINRIAVNRFNERSSRANEIASERATDRMLGQFTEQTDEALGEGLTQLDDLRSREGELRQKLSETRGEISTTLAEREDGSKANPFEMIDQFVLPRVFISTTDSTLNVEATLEGDNRLASSSQPPLATIPVDIRVQLHETMVSNLIAPVVQDRLIQSWQIRNLAETFSEDGGASLPEEDEERRWALRFDEGRPIQIEFEGDELGVRIFGKSFQQGRERYTDPINIYVRLRVINDDGTLKLIRMGYPTVEFTYDPPPGKIRSAKSITFRQFLVDSLETALKGDPMEQAIELPANLIPMDYIEDEEIQKQLANAKLVELSAQNGWLNIGWNYVESQAGSWVSQTPAIWPSAAASAPEEEPESEDVVEPPKEDGSDSPNSDG